ncbi:MAG TPA: myxococcus cysteine-rich repeat containing protein [Sandaracinaceae bacterium LLY-WYZ-13_1]|nr:myxococcus cysteine-rich repeat containing protein [Sandaracinaceae bacterium LLY-WYZ-13_1]
MRSARALAVSLAGLLVASCASDARGLPMAINDPFALIDDVEGPLRLYVLPAETYACDETSGVVSPEVPELPEGMLADAVADVALDVADSRAMTDLEVVGGEYVVFVRGKGTDPVTMRPDQVIARACRPVTIEAGETREARLTLIPVIGMGECGDGIRSPDEQCDDGNTADGDGCSATCRTESFLVNTTTAGMQENPSAAGAMGQRWVFEYLSERSDSFLRYLEPDLSPVTSPSVLMNDGPLDAAFSSGAARPLDAALAMHDDGRVVVAFVDFAAGQDAKVGFLNQSRTAEADPAVVRDGTTGAVHVAFAGDGSAMVVFEDDDSATGLSGQVFAPGATTPGAADPFEVGQGTTGGERPRVAGAGDHFVVAFAAGGTAHVQRFGTDGSARDAMAQPVDGGAMQSEATVAALADGRALVAWRQGGGDGDGSGVSARAFAADGSAVGEAFTVNTTTAGDQGAPAVAAGQEVFAVLFTSGGGLRARTLAADGTPVSNHDQPPTTADYAVSGSGVQPTVATGSLGGEPVWMAVWNEAGDIRARPFPLP